MSNFDGLELTTLRDALERTMNGDDLKNLADVAGVKRKPSRKAEVADAIVDLLDGGGLDTAWARLDDIQKAAVAEVVHSGSSRFRPDRFSAKYGAEPAWDTGTRARYGYSSRGAPSLLCLFFYSNSRVWVMPDDLKKRLKEFVPKPRSTTIETFDELPLTFRRGSEQIDIDIRATERAAQREILAILRLVDAGKVAVSDKTHKPTGSTIKAISAVLVKGDFYSEAPQAGEGVETDEQAGPIKAFAWPVIIQAGGLARLDGKRLTLTKAGRGALGKPPNETIKALWAKWESTTLLDELSRIDCIKGQTGKGRRGLVALPSRRESITETLSDCPSGRWFSADAFIRFIRASGRSTSVTRDAWALYVGDANYGSLGYDLNIRQAEDRYVLAVLFEYAATLGLVDIAVVPPAHARRDDNYLWGFDSHVFFSRYDGLLYVRVTALGAYCLGTALDYLPPDSQMFAGPAAFSVLPNLEIAAIAEELGSDDQLALEAYATKVSDRVWRLDADRLLGVVEQGGSVGEVRDFLQTRNAEPLPETVTHFLDDVEVRCRKFRLAGAAELIECADSVMATLVANDSNTRAHCMVAGENYLVVPRSSESAFRRGLRKSGYMLAT